MTIKSIIAAVLAAFAIGTPVATAMPTEPLGSLAQSAPAQDLRSPDARGETESGRAWSVLFTDVRSPDARPGAPITSTLVVDDLRSPDAVAGTGTSTPEVTLVEVAKPVEASGFNWEDAGLGAGIAAALGLLALGGAHAVARHRTVPVG